MSSRIVAIVGRPNVGKSAIFNRLVGRRLAIVHEESGVTRDRLVCEAEYSEERFELVDTGGIGNMDGAKERGTISAAVRRQVDVVLGDAAAVLFVVDVEAGIVPLDEEVAGILRSSGQQVFTVANKADNASRDSDAVEFEKFGFPVFSVSALHNRGFDVVMPQVVGCLPEAAQDEGRTPLKIAVVGRPNVGKSSYINRLLRSDRVIVSDVPGTTRDSVETPFAVGSGKQARHYQLIDTAGIRRRGKVRDAVEQFSLLRAEASIKRADLAVLVVEAEKGITTQDRKIAHMVLAQRKGCAILVNKWDESSRTQRKWMEDFKGELESVKFVPIAFVSAKNGYNVKRAIDTMDHVASQIRTELPTGILNRALMQAHERVQPPLVSGKRLKLFYCAQTGTRPIRITMFVNDPKRMKPAYQAYLEKSLRKAFGLEGAPIVFQLKARRGDRRREGR